MSLWSIKTINSKKHVLRYCSVLIDPVNYIHVKAFYPFFVLIVCIFNHNLCNKWFCHLKS